MKVSHVATAVDVAFDDPNLIADAGLVPVLALAEQIGLSRLVAEHVAITGHLGNLTRLSHIHTSLGVAGPLLTHQLGRYSDTRHPGDKRAEAAH